MARPREFEPDEALHAIKGVFWRLGFEGASLQEIEAATNLNKQSLYRLFGDKRGMYLAALEHYEQHEMQEAKELLAIEGTARRRFARLFNQVVDNAVKTGDRRGCFLCNASVDQAQLDVKTRKRVKRLLDNVRKLFSKTLAASHPYNKNPGLRAQKAAQLLAAYFGLRVLIKANASETVLRRAVKASLNTI